MLGVGDGVTDHVLQEDFENTACLFVDETRDTLDTSSASETTDGGLGDALDVVSEDLPVALGASLSKTFASFAATRHNDALSSCLLALKFERDDSPAKGHFPKYTSLRAKNHGISPDLIVNLCSIAHAQLIDPI